LTAVVPVVFLAILTLIVALPCLLTDILLLPGGSVREALMQDRVVSEQSLDAFEQSRKNAFQWRRTHEIFDDLAMAELRKLQNERTKAVLPRILAQTINWQKQSLAQSPADTYGWARLAFLDLAEGAAAQAALALEYSIEAAPFEPRLIMFRVTMAMRLKDKLGPAMQARIPDLITQAWRQNPKLLVDTAMQGNFLHQAEIVLSDNPDALEQFRNLAGLATKY
jgi:hypothetical protein